jgi:hypothetical protein
MNIIAYMLERPLPFPTLQIADSIREDEAVARTDRLNDAASNVVLAST